MPSISHRWAFIICSKEGPNNKGSEVIILMSKCRDCDYFRGFYETGVKCVHDYAVWLERQGLELDI